MTSPLPVGESQGEALVPPSRRALAALRDFGRFAEVVGGRVLYPYQLEAGRAVVRAVLRREGGPFSILMSRQAGKNELSARLQAYLLTLHHHRGGTIVKAAPTFRPQVVNSILRLKEALDNPLAHALPVHGQHGYILALGRARAFFLSAEPTASVVGATASLLLEIDEAQDVDPDKHDRDFAPMAAVADAVRVYYGTAGRPDDLLQRIKQLNLEREARDGVRRHFEYPWHVVAQDNPLYARFVLAERDRLGQSHPIFQSQYELKPLSPADALLDAIQLRAFQGDHPRQSEPIPDRVYVAGVDLAGPSESPIDPLTGLPRVDRDSTVVAIAELDTTSPFQQLRVVHLVEWRGRPHQSQHHDLVRLLDEIWHCRTIVVDSSGLGSAPAEYLHTRLGDRVIRFTINGRRKTQLGFDLISAANAARLTMYAAEADDREAATFWSQLRNTRRHFTSAEQMSWSAHRGHDDCHRDVGIGISQVLPVLVEAFAAKDSIVAIEQPELHLHPALQAELGDVFIESAKERGNTFLIETHSEHLILRLMRRMRETAENRLPEGEEHLALRPEDVAILFVQPVEASSIVREMRVSEDGQQLDEWPDGFFEVSFRERFA